jgi:TonB-linked SusC/RagA family outer membrane protein
MSHNFTWIRSCMFIFLSVLTTLSYAQTGNLTGVVLSEKREGLIGATVKVKGTAIGGACDLDGKYSIMNIPVGEQTFVVSYVGFLPQEIAINIKEGENVQPAIILKEDKMLLNEVVVVGYGTQVKHDMSSSASEVKAADLADKPVDNFASALAGEAAGVQITTDNGVAGSTTTVRVRGTHSLSSGADPLYVIDGVQIVSYDISIGATGGGSMGYDVSPLASINPNDIESIEILKDAAATAIYGARGANGVIIVTTKSGKEGKTKIDFAYSTGISTPAHEIKLLNGPQYIQMYNEAYRNDSIAHVAGAQNFKSRFGFPADSAANTNWLKQVFRPGYFQEANVSTSGGNAKTTFYTGMGIRDEKTFLKGNSFQRISLLANVNHTASKHFDFGVNINLTRTDNHYIPTSYSGGLGAAQSSMLPIFPVYNPNGSYNTDGGANPVAQINLIQQEAIVWRTIDNIFFNVRFGNGFTFHNEFGIDLIQQQEQLFYPSLITGVSGDAQNRTDEYFTYNFTSTLDYKKTFKEIHSFEALVGFNPTATIEKFSYENGTGLSNPAFTQVQNAVVDSTTGTAGTGRQWSFASFFGRINYKLKNRYLFQVSFRADGSSRFSDGNRFGYFPAGSFGWVMTEEKFLKSQKVITLLKLRASSGLVGNAEFTNDFAYYSTFSTNSYAGQTGIAPTQTSVPNLTWESTLKNDVGVDYGFFDGRLSGLVDFYYEYTYNELIQAYPLSPSSGYSSVTENRGKTRNDGAEVQFTSYNIKSKSKFTWNTTVNFALNRNKVLDLGGVDQVEGTGPNRNRAIVGYPVGVYWLAQYAGVDPATGQPLIYDFSGHKVLATATTVETYSKPTGRPYPLFQGGITNTFSYKGLSLTVLLTYSYGNEIYDDGGKYQSYTLSNYFNQTTDILARWQKAGDVTNIPKLSTLNYDNLNSSLFLHDASYLKVKNIILAYSLQPSIVAKMRMRTFRIFVSVQNAATATPYKGWDPEYNRDNSGAITQGASYLGTPQARTYTIGFNFGL